MAAAAAMRHWQRALRLAVAFPRQAAALSGSDIVGRPSGVLPSSSSSSTHTLPALQEFTRAFSSADFSPGSKSVGPSDVHAYNDLISRINLKSRPNLHRLVYDDMLLDGVQPMYDTFFLLISGCMKGSRLQDVMYFFEEMKAMGLTPDVAFYNCVIAACGRSCQVNRAFQVAEEMEESGIQPRHRTFLALLRSCAIAGKVDEAYGVVRRMAASGLSLDKNFYCALILAHKNKKPQSEDTTQKIFELLEQSKQQPAEDPMAVAATGDSEWNVDPDDGLASLLSDDTQPRWFKNPKLAVYHAAVKSLTELGNKEAVKAVLKMVEMDRYELDSYCVIQLIKCYLAEGDFEQACAEYSKYLDSRKRPTLELYLILIEGALDNYSPESSAVAQGLLAELTQKGFFLNAQVGSLLLRRACQPRSRDVTVANMVWDMMKTREVTISKFLTQEYYRTLEISNVPKDDPRIIEVKASVDAGRRVTFKPQTDLSQTAPTKQMTEQTAPAEQMPEEVAPAEQMPEHVALENQIPEQMTSSGQVPGHASQSELDMLYSEPSGDDRVDEESPIETGSISEMLNLPPAEVQHHERVG